MKRAFKLFFGNGDLCPRCGKYKFVDTHCTNCGYDTTPHD